jgi:cytochrome P450
MGTEYIKAPFFYETLGVLDGLATIIDPEKHRFYRTILNPIFSTKAVDALAPSILSTIERAGNVLTRHGQVGSNVNLTRLYSSITVSLYLTCFFVFSRLSFSRLSFKNDSNNK